MFFGPPGSGKGTQAKLLAASTGYRHISTGDLLRDLKTKSNLSNDEKIALSHMDRGELVPSYLIYKLAFAEIENALKNTPGVILDGAVRSLEQAREYEKFFEQNGWVVQVQALSINLTDEESFERLTKRRVCSKCGQIYIYNENLNEICQECGGAVVVRSDDDSKSVKERLNVQGNTALKPILEYYNNLGVLKNIDGKNGIENVQEQILKALS